MVKRHTVLVALALVCAAWGPTSAQTRDPAEGVITATRYGAVVGGSRVSIEIRNFEDYSPELAGAIGQALEERGFVVVSEGDLILFVDTSTNQGAEDEPAALQVDPGNLPPGAEVESQVAVPLGLDERGGSRGLRYSVSVTLAARGRAPTWIGNASAVVSGGDRQSIFSALGRALVAAIGDDIEARRIEVR